MKNVIIIPTYNERENIEPLIREIFATIPDISVLVVDDSSPDGTAQAAKNMMAEYPNLRILERSKKDGLGGAYIAGFKEVLKNADLERVITMDGDFSHSPKYIPEMLKLSNDYDLIIGSRYVQGGGGVPKWELWRRLLSRGANMYVRMVLRKPIMDWTSGFNCIRADFLRKLDFTKIDLSGYAFLQELKYMLLKVGARAKELPIIFAARRGGESKISGFIIREGILGPWKIRKRK